DPTHSRSAHMTYRAALALLASLLALSCTRATHVSPSRQVDARGEALAWSPSAAARYLDSRMEWWSTWPNAKRDHGTSCVSCHTAVPYALARPALRGLLGESGPTTSERQLIDGVVTRVRAWRDVQPFYPDQQFGLPKSSE